MWAGRTAASARFLTRELGPGGRAVGGVRGVAAEAVVRQLTVPDPEAQQDPVDLLLGGRLQGGKDGGLRSGEAKPIFREKRKTTGILLGRLLVSSLYLPSLWRPTVIETHRLGRERAGPEGGGRERTPVPPHPYKLYKCSL